MLSIFDPDTMQNPAIDDPATNSILSIFDPDTNASPSMNDGNVVVTTSLDCQSNNLKIVGIAIYDPTCISASARNVVGAAAGAAGT